MRGREPLDYPGGSRRLGSRPPPPPPPPKLQSWGAKLGESTGKLTPQPGIAAVAAGLWPFGPSSLSTSFLPYVLTDHHLPLVQAEGPPGLNWEKELGWGSCVSPTSLSPRNLLPLGPGMYLQAPPPVPVVLPEPLLLLEKSCVGSQCLRRASPSPVGCA